MNIVVPEEVTETRKDLTVVSIEFMRPNDKVRGGIEGKTMVGFVVTDDDDI